MNRPRLSVAMCTYNGSRFVSEQLQSIATQSCLPYELVVCDDGSTDDTIAVIRTFAPHAPFRVRVFSNDQTLGVSKNFEKAIQNCDGDVIALSDQDDIWNPEKLERLSEALDNHSRAGYAFSDAEIVSEDGKSLGISLLEDLGLKRGPMQRFVSSGQLEVLLKVNVVMGASLAFRTSLKGIILPISPRWMHDHWIAVLGSTLSYGVCLSECLLKYRRHPAQQMGIRYAGRSRRKISLATTRQEYWAKLEAFRELHERVQSATASYPAPSASLDLLAGKEEHLSRRAAIHSTKGISRVVMALSEAFTGRYQRFSDSWRSFGRDLTPSSFLAKNGRQE